MKIAVIGGNRFTGKKLVEKLIQNKDNEVTLFNRTESGHEKAIKFKFDRDEDKVKLDKFDCVVDMCLYKLEQFKRIKKSIPKNIKYIFMSTGAVEHIKEFGLYAKQKKAIEKALSKTDLDYTIIRPSYIDGIDNHLIRIEYYIYFLTNDLEIEISGGKGDYPINLVDVDDVVKAMFKIITTDYEITKGKTYNICSSKSTTIDKLIDFIKKELKIEKHKVRDSLAAPFPKYPLELDNKFTEKELEMKFGSWRGLVRKIIRKLKSEDKI